MESWPFADKPNIASITTRLCGTTEDPADARVVGLGQTYKRDATIGELADLPEGWQASRTSPDRPWQRGPA